MARESVDDLSNSDIMSDMVVRESQASDPNEISVLVVDDEAPNIDSLRRIFEREGFSVRTATSGQKALDICRHHEVHVVVSDLMMPGMNGIELVKALKTVVPDAEVVLMTAFGTVEKAVEAMRAGAYDFVEKPLKRMQMVKTVRKAAERHQLIVENKDLRQQLSQLSDRSIIGSARIASERSRDRHAGRSVVGQRADPRRERDRQGTARAFHPRTQWSRKVRGRESVGAA